MNSRGDTSVLHWPHAPAAHRPCTLARHSLPLPLLSLPPHAPCSLLGSAARGLAQAAPSCRSLHLSPPDSASPPPETPSHFPSTLTLNDSPLALMSPKTAVGSGAVPATLLTPTVGTAPVPGPHLRSRLLAGNQPGPAGTPVSPTESEHSSPKLSGCSEGLQSDH